MFITKIKKEYFEYQLYCENKMIMKHLSQHKDLFVCGKMYVIGNQKYQVVSAKICEVLNDSEYILFLNKLVLNKIEECDE